MLPAPSRLSRREDFALAVRRGRRLAGPGVVVHSFAGAPPGDAEPSGALVGFVVGKNVGNAVTRNLVRRRLRHVMSPHVDQLPAGARVVLRATPAATERSFADLAATVDDLLARAAR